MHNVITLSITYERGEVAHTIYPVMLQDDTDLILVDCGYPHSLELLQQAAHDNGVDLCNLTTVIITHHDYDHMGSLAALRRAYPAITVYASTEDAPYISGGTKSLRLQQAERLYDTLPASEKASARNFQQALESIETTPVDVCVSDGEVFPWYGGLEVITTPGHMPGHISLYLHESRMLIAGDALVIDGGQLGIANPQYTLDIAEAKRSIAKLLAYDIEKIICYHGGEFTNNIRESLQAIISTR